MQVRSWAPVEATQDSLYKSTTTTTTITATSTADKRDTTS